MTSFRIREIENLARQLRRGPKRLVLRHLLNIEFALSVVKPEKRYPAEFVWHAVTGVRPFSRNGNGDEPVLLHGGDLRRDLATLAEFLSAGAPLLAGACPESVYSTAELAERFDVSLRTISRWRKRGLVAWKLTDPSGRMHTAFPDRAVRRFVVENAGLVRRATDFSLLNVQEHYEIITRARALAEGNKCTIHSVAQAIAAETGRGRETIRLIIKRHDETCPRDAIFKQRAPSDRVRARRLQIWEAHQDGVMLETLAKKFETPIADVYRIVAEMRAREIESRPIEYIASEEFTMPNADAVILKDHAVEHLYVKLPSKQRVPPDLPPYLRELFNLPLLTPAGEFALFRKMNYLKFQAESLRRQIVPETVKAADLDRIEALLDDAGEIKNRITRANLRLVVRFAKRHMSPLCDLFELVSDGNVALLRAIDLFDFTRGFKFSTYVSWAVIRQLAGATSKAQRQRARYQTGQEEFREVLSATMEEDEPAADARALLGRMSTSLSTRQWFVLCSHFGLNGHGKPKTLEQIGKRLGVTKERIRQIESQAFGHLRQTFSEQFKRLWN